MKRRIGSNRHFSSGCHGIICSLGLLAIAFLAPLAVAGENPSDRAVKGGGVKNLPIPVFPGAQGFGTETAAGRGGEIIRVKNLKDRGEGSFRAAVEAEHARIVVFEVGGVISLSEPLKIDSPFITVAGQTAPSPGITLIGAGLVVKTHDVLVQHLRIRVGDDPRGPPPEDRDAIKILGAGTYNVVLDHLSASWAIDENISTWYDPHDVTISHCIASEGLHDSLKKESHSKGILVGDDSRNISLIGNLMAHNVGRNPRIKGGVTAVVVNNVAYNGTEYVWMEIGSDAGPSLVSTVGNLFLNGPGKAPQKAVVVKKDASPGTQVYLSENYAPVKLLSYRTSFDPEVAFPPVWHPSIRVVPTRKVESWVLENAGARPADRDSVDRRIVKEVKTRGGSIINSQEDVGGWPVYPQTKRSLEIPAFPHKDDDGDGYTNIEELLHRMSKKVQTGQGL